MRKIIKKSKDVLKSSKYVSLVKDISSLLESARRTSAKVGKFTHADAGQMHLYLNYAREHWLKN